MLSTATVGLAIESLVAVLLVLTIGYCWVLNQRLTRLRADERALRTTIVELVNTTEIAERAIATLRTTVTECDRTLSGRLDAADKAGTDLAAQIRSGEAVLGRIALITEAARKQTALREPEVSPAATAAALHGLFGSPQPAPAGFGVPAQPPAPPVQPEPALSQAAATARATAALAEALAARARARVGGIAA